MMEAKKQEKGINVSSNIVHRLRFLTDATIHGVATFIVRKMFAKPRPKKSPLPPPSKKRKTTPAIEEISFDDGARQEYLTGFHKRKLQRIKHAQNQAAQRARAEKLESRKQVRPKSRT